MEPVTELERLRRFEWNVLQAYDRGGDQYLANAVKWLIDNPVPTKEERAIIFHG